MLDVVALRIGIPWTFHFFSPTYALYAAQTFFTVLSAVTQKRSPMLPKCFVIFVPLFCLLLPYEGTLMLLTPFEMLVRYPVLLVLPYTRRVYAGQKCVVLLTRYIFRVPGSVFKAGLIFLSFFLFFIFLHIFPLPTYERCRRCSNSILLLDCLVFR